MEKITGAEHFNVTPKFPQNGVFSLKFCIFQQNVPTTRRLSDNFPTAKNFWWVMASLPGRH